MLAIHDAASELIERYGEPVPPLPARPDRTYSYRFGRLELERWEFRLRKPAVSVEGMIHCTVRGDCLEPVLSGELRMAFDPRLAADDGDLVLIRWHDDYLDRLVHHVEHASPEWRDRWMRVYAPNGEHPNCAVKVLRHDRGRHWVTWNQGGVPLDGNATVLGVCRYAEDEHGRPLGGSYGPWGRFFREWALEFGRW